MPLMVKNLSFSYREKQLFSDFSISLESGDFVLLMGPSGCGKSSLLKTLAGIYPQYGGKISGSSSINGCLLAEEKANDRAKQVGLLFQNPREQFVMQTVEEEFAFTLENLSVDPKQMSEKIDEVLERVGLSDFRKRLLSELSGGELQKVALAEVLLTGAKYLLLDEPFAAVDQASRADLQGLLASLAKEGYAILVSDHDDHGYLDKITAFYSFASGHFEPVEKEQWPKKKERKEVRIQKKQNRPVLFDLKNVAIENDQRHLIHQVELAITAGEWTLVTGPNGSGKSSFLKVLARLLKADGSMTYLGHDFSKWKKKDYYRQVTMLFQNSLDQFINITVEEEIQQVRQQSYQKLYWTDEKVSKVISTLGLDGLSNRSVYTLSGGQQKKLQLLLMVVMASPVLLLDEPLAGLDSESVRAVLALMTEVKDNLNITLLVVSHQVDQLASLVNRHLTLQNGEFVDEEVVAI
ncbi:ABC transporter ATP-binding protein [Fructobacillus parabroussonetiae]|uniref:ABC transporter ATP-binding protein n=1 Tax=Fructobacillus parabroussonetiae TaxID=2713174 RepID=A0ABS5QVM6_9LACO|nr:ABC transporter ATP-binding protein [Fructobacillus parabroussonetiae]MBS9337258.1 ABC transporter ATP-binding protein [Fructobacillus parabroussonetiae]